MHGHTSARVADPTLLNLVWEILFGQENPIITIGQSREEVAEPKGQAAPGGTSLVKHFSRSTVPFPQVRLILLAIPPGRAAMHAPVGLQPGSAPRGCDPYIHSLDRRCYQVLASSFVIPHVHGQRHLLFRLLSSSSLSIISPCNWSLQGLSKPEPLDFGLVIYLLALDALKSGGNRA